MNKIRFLLWLPIAVLVLWTASLSFERSQGTFAEVRVEGFDPRDLLAGRYLWIQTDYGVKCDAYHSVAYVCPDGSGWKLARSSKECQTFVKGKCYGKNSRFDDGIRRFYVSENKAFPLESALRDKNVNATLVISVLKDGRIFPVDLKINGVPWKEWKLVQGQE